MQSKNSNNRYKFLFISFFSFLISIMFLNIIFFFTDSASISGKITAIFMFCLNLSFFLKYYNLKVKKKFFPMLFILFSIFFRIYEYYLFFFLVQKGILLTFSWMISLTVSFLCKFLIFDKLFSKENT